MPKRTDIRTILIIGSGPIAIGQGCEFDYSGAQACKSLRAEGYRVVLVNSNPATIMTDPAMSDRTYVEPITPEAVEKIIKKEAELGAPIDAVLPTLGGQTGLNCACELFDAGVFERHGVEMIGATREVIHRAEDRKAFAELCDEINLATPESKTVTDLQDALEYVERIGLPAIIRPAFTLGGFGGGIAYNLDEFKDLVMRGIDASMIDQVQVDRSLIGWKEYELEVVRDKNDNCVIVCGIENIDAMGVHTGDSVTVAPIQTLTDKEYQALRDAAIAVMRRVGVETGGSNVQFAVNPDPEPLGDGSRPFEFVVVEMNPRVSRSSALASKATGFPIAKIAAKLAVGYSLDELRNDITGTTSACFEPAIDYVVTKFPRWTFEKFPEADETLTTQMKSVGEVMSIGRTFKESYQKAIRSLDVKRFGLGLDKNDKWLAAMRAVEHAQLVLDISPGVKPGSTGLRTADGQPIEWPIGLDKLSRKLSVPSQGRPYYVRYAFKMGWSIERVHELTGIDPWFLDEMLQLVEFEDTLTSFASLEEVTADVMHRAKQLGYSDAQLANLYLGNITSENILKVRRFRESLGISPVFKLVDTCAAEFEAVTPYFYSTYERPYEIDGVARTDNEVRVSDAPKVIILGGGPNRIGQGIEFDYCCVHAAFASKDLGFESVMVNCNPETVSTDYDTSDMLFFEPLTLEDVLNVCEQLNAGGGVRGVIVQFGGQTPLNLAHGLQLAGVPLLGTSLDSIDLAEDRDRFDHLLEDLRLERPASGIARSLEEATGIADRIGFPVLVRPSYVLGGRGMEICSDAAALRHYMATAVDISDLAGAPVLIDKFLDGAVEIDVDVVADFDPATGEGRALVCGVMEHTEHAGVHSGDSSCTIPPWSLGPMLVDQLRTTARTLAEALRVRGLMNVQMAVKDGQVSIIEVNPRASRTVPFVGKAKSVAWAQVAAKAMLGISLEEQGAVEVPETGAYAVKGPVFPFSRFPGVDVVLGPEMRSTGEVMGMDWALPIAYLKAQMAAGNTLPREGGVFVSVREQDKPEAVAIARSLMAMGFEVYTTRGTGELMRRQGLRPKLLEKLSAGARPNVIDLMSNHEIQLVVNTPTRTGWATDEGKIRAAAVRLGVPMITTLTGAKAAVEAIQALRAGEWDVAALQDYAASPAEKGVPS
ncbi:MAG: carbamoyl-phosphate synthase large subunit [Planctomycetota bacterium]